MKSVLERHRDLAALIAGLVAGTGARGLKMREIHMLVYHIAKRLGRSGEWCFEATSEGPRSKLVEEVVDALLDAGVLTYRFEPRALQDPYYAIVEPEALEWLPTNPLFAQGYEEADKLIHRSKLTSIELEGLVYLLHPEAWKSRNEKIERVRVKLAARLAARGLLSVEEAARLAGVEPRVMEKLIEEAREEVELDLPLEE